MEEIDNQIERYLRHQMTEAEEVAFVKELEINESIRQQAKQVALLIKVLNADNKDKEVVADIFSSNLDSLIDSYIRHKMSVEQEKAFKELLSNNKELREKVRTTLLLINQVSHDTTETDAIIEDVKNPSVINLQTLFRRKWIEYAAMVVLVAGIGFGGFHYKRSYELDSLATELYSSYEKSELPNQYRGGNNRDFDECKFAMAKLKENIESGNNIPDCLNRLSKLYQDVTGDEYTDFMNFKSDIARLYVIAHLKNGDKKEAIALLERIILDEPDSPDAKWALEVKLRVEDIW